MATVKTMAEIRTKSHIKSFRSICNATGFSTASLDQQMITRAIKRLHARQLVTGRYALTRPKLRH